MYKQFLLLICVLCWLVPQSVIAKQYHMILEHTNGEFRIPENRCDNANGSRWPMYSMKNGDSLIEASLDYTAQLEDATGKVLVENGITIPRVIVGDSVPDIAKDSKEPFDLEGRIVEVTKSVVVVTLPYLKNGRKIRIVGAGYEGVSAGMSVFELDVEGFPDNSSPESGFLSETGILDIVLVPDGYSKDFAGLLQLFTEFGTVENWFLSNYPIGEFADEIMFHVPTTEVQAGFLNGCENAWAEGCDAACIQCHATTVYEAPDEILLMQNNPTVYDGGGFRTCGGGRLSSYGFFTNYRGVFYPDRFKDLALHEASHSIFGLDDEYIYDSFYSGTPCANGNCSNDPTCGSNNCANCSFLPSCLCSCIPGCMMENFCRCQEFTCKMHYAESSYCPRCETLVMQYLTHRN